MPAIRVAVIGGSGFIGTNMLQFYIEKGMDVRNIDIAAPRNNKHFKWWSKVDILDLETLEKAINSFSPTHLIHLAARTDLNERKDIKGYFVNTAGVENIINAVNICHNIKRIIFASSMLVCRRGDTPDKHDDYSPTTLYGRSKMFGEKIIKEYKDIRAEWVIVRPTSIWGPWFGEPYRRFFDIVIEGKYAHPGSRSGTKTFGYVENTVYQMDKLLFSDDPGITGRTFYLGDYVPVNISEWADRIAGILDRKPFKRIPYPVFAAAAVTGDILKMAGYKQFPMSSFRLKNMTENNIIELSDIRGIAPSLPYSMDEGIRRTLRWMKGEK